VPYTPGDPQDALDAAHAEAWRALYGFARGPVALEVVQLTAQVSAPVPLALPELPDPFQLPEAGVRGPTRLDCPTTSVWVPSGWAAQRGPANVLILRRAKPQTRESATTRSPAGVALWASRFMSVAEQAGARLQRLARSVSIRERLDFSVAVFDAQGGLVANAPHVPVHLGAMGETVRDLLAAVPEPEDGDAWLTNDPAAGGSHLPDLTVITAIVHEGHRFFVASRGHHVDVGGLTPGSMPPHSRTLDDEGLVFRRWPLQRSGRLTLPDLAGSRQPEVVAADLSAQLAANHEGARLLRKLGDGATLTAWMAHLQDVAAEAVARLIARLPEGEAEDTLDGAPLRLGLRVRSGVLSLDFTGTCGPHPGNLNAPRGVVRAAALYALRVLAGEPLPLNEGALRHVRLILPPGSVVDPPPGAAVAGGNVETSQRLVDLILKAAGARAASQGTMNNLTLGGPGWAFYETLGGGVGASASGPGASATQVHMTNTRATDPEVLESRLPLRVCRFSLRAGSGGAGTHRGGDGLVRELELLTDGEASLLAAWRAGGAPGLGGGGAGAPGFAEVRRDGVWTPWDGARVALNAGDRVRVGTPGGGGWSRGERPPTR
jgi:5-oxoprolinase (ATP-hydrolysing)